MKQPRYLLFYPEGATSFTPEVESLLKVMTGMLLNTVPILFGTSDAAVLFCTCEVTEY